MQLVLIGAAGFLGAVTRYLVDLGVASALGSRFPWATLVINTSGSLILGVLFVVGVERAMVPDEMRLPLTVGFVGTYTTFSTYMLDAWRLFEDGRWPLGLVYIGGSIVAGLVAVAAGVLIARAA